MNSTCTGCGSEVSGSDRFCRHCGAALSGNPPDKTEERERPIAAGRGLGQTIMIVLALVVLTGTFFIWRQFTQTAEVPETGQGGQSATEDPHNIQNLPTDFASLVQLGNEQMDARFYPVAAECYKRALQLNPDDENVRVDFGVCLHEMGLSRRAAEELAWVHRKNPAHEFALLNLGVVYWDMNVRDTARTYLEKYREQFPSGSQRTMVDQLLAP